MPQADDPAAGQGRSDFIKDFFLFPESACVLEPICVRVSIYIRESLCIRESVSGIGPDKGDVLKRKYVGRGGQNDASLKTAGQPAQKGSFSAAADNADEPSAYLKFFKRTIHGKPPFRCTKVGLYKASVTGYVYINI